MSIASVAAQERDRICDLMLELGPEAPTLDEGWVVLDLAAHLAARERDLWAAPGIVLGGPFETALGIAMNRRKRQGLDRLVDLVRSGPPPWWKFAPAGAHLNEYFIHHEDVRRANGGQPRQNRELDEALARLLRASSRMLLRNVDTGVDLVWKGGLLVRHGQRPRAVLDGAPGELLLYLSGRTSAAAVDFAGNPEAVERLRSTDLRL